MQDYPKLFFVFFLLHKRLQHGGQNTEDAGIPRITGFVALEMPSSHLCTGTKFWLKSLLAVKTEVEI